MGFGEGLEYEGELAYMVFECEVLPIVLVKRRDHGIVRLWKLAAEEQN